MTDLIPSRPTFFRPLQVTACLLIGSFLIPAVHAQGARLPIPDGKVSDRDADHPKERSEWFSRGRVVPGQASAALRHRAYQAKMRARSLRASRVVENAISLITTTTGSWSPLGPAPLSSDATGNGTQDYHEVTGRATAVAIDPADPTGNTLYIGGAQSGVWKSTNAATNAASGVTWTALTDSQPTLSIGALAIQPGNSDPAKTVILAATGEANNSGDSYFGLGILRSTDGGNTWTLIPSANGGALSFSGLGGTRIAFNSNSGQKNVAIAAMATSSEGLIDGAVTANTTRGLYTSLDAGQTWSYSPLVDPGGATDATSATSVVYNAGASKFFAAVRYHGFYSSSDGVNWTRLAVQPGGTALSTAACPPQSTSNRYGCPIYRGEIAVVPGRNEMYVWYVSVDSNGGVSDGYIWQSLNGGASWNKISDDGITNCGDLDGCGVEQGTYDLELLAVPNGADTALFAGSINLYKCDINSQNASCSNSSFLNLTHVYGCNPIAAPAHVHPDQHALAFTNPNSGTDSGNTLMFFANDGGIYRALDGIGGLNSGVCSGTNLFDDLNQNLGSMTQFVSFSQHPTDPDTIFGGTQDNGSPATNHATTNPAWGNILGGDGGYNAIDPAHPTNFYAANPDIPPAGLGVQVCTSGVSCTDSGFKFIATSSTLGGDDGAFYFPYVLDPQSAWAMLVGTCRVWRGSRAGGAFTALSPNFDTLGSGTCSGSEVNQVRALAAGGPTDNNGSKVIYATTSGYGPTEGLLYPRAGGRVWVTTNATAGSPAFTDVTENGPSGSINPNQYPVSSVTIDSADASGNTAYVTVMGFTGGVGHVWKTTNAGASWADFTSNLPDSPVNCVLVDGPGGQIYVGTDVGVFASSTATANWVELGPDPASNQPGFLPNVAVTALGLFNYGGQKLLRASTYGRGIWQYNLITMPDYQLGMAVATQAVFVGQTAVFNGTATALNGYASSIALSCVAGVTAPPSTCNVSPATLTPGDKTGFAVTSAGAAGDYNFNVQADGSDSKQITHQVPLTLHVVNFGLTNPSPSTVSTPHGTTSPPVSFQITAAGSFNQAVTVSCNVALSGATCNLTPGSSVYPTATAPVNMIATVLVPDAAAAGNYTGTIQASTAGAPATLTTSFTVQVTRNPDFVLTEPSSFPLVNAGSSGTSGPISIVAQDGFSGTLTLSCPNTFGAGSCSIAPSSVSSFPATATLTINGSSFAAGSYSLAITGSSGALSHSLTVPFNVGDYSISGTQALSLAPGGQGTANLTLAASTFYSGKIKASCDVSALSGGMCSLGPANPVTLAASGTASLTATINVPNATALGTYDIIIDTQDLSGAPTHNFTVSLKVAEDFEVVSTTPSQTVTAGQISGPYNLTIQPVGGSFNGAITLSCSGLPAYSQCAFNPSTPITPGTSAVNVVLTISTMATTGALGSRPQSSFIYVASLGLPGFLLVCGMGSRRRNGMMAMLFLVLMVLVLMPACSGVSSGGGGGGHQGTPPGTYNIKVTGTSSGTPPDAGQNTQVTLVVH